MFDALSDKITGVFRNLRGYGKLTEQNIETALREVRLALFEADVAVSVVKSFLEKVRLRALGTEVLQSLTPHQQFLTIVHEELVSLLGGAEKNLVFGGSPPHIVMMVGLQGSGKTTSAGKLALHFKKKGRRPYLVPADIYRPAAIDQLQQLGKSLDVPFFATGTGQQPVEIVQKALEDAQLRFCDILLVDTAGRLHIDNELMNELRELKKNLPAPKILFVADAMTGQEAVHITKAFNDLLHIDGVILTKLDGDARGGAVLSIQSVTTAPIYFVGVGEKVDDFESFDASRLVSRLLDRGDLMALVEKAKGVVDEEQGRELVKKIRQNRFSLEDFRNQLRLMKKLGSMQSLMGMLPGAKALSKQVDFDKAQKELKVKTAIIDSMTVKERLHPELLNGSRRIRIARGSGTQVSDVNRFMKEFMQMQKMMKQFSQKGMGALKGMLGI